MVPVEFYGSSPHEVMTIGGFDKDKFTEQKKAAKLKRLATNRELVTCCKVNKGLVIN